MRALKGSSFAEVLNGAVVGGWTYGVYGGFMYEISTSLDCSTVLSHGRRGTVQEIVIAVILLSLHKEPPVE